MAAAATEALQGRPDQVAPWQAGLVALADAGGLGGALPRGERRARKARIAALAATAGPAPPALRRAVRSRQAAQSGG